MESAPGCEGQALAGSPFLERTAQPSHLMHGISSEAGSKNSKKRKSEEVSSSCVLTIRIMTPQTCDFVQEEEREMP